MVELLCGLCGLFCGSVVGILGWLWFWGRFERRDGSGAVTGGQLRSFESRLLSRENGSANDTKRMEGFRLEMGRLGRELEGNSRRLDVIESKVESLGRVLKGPGEGGVVLDKS